MTNKNNNKSLARLSATMLVASALGCGLGLGEKRRRGGEICLGLAQCRDQFRRSDLARLCGRPTVIRLVVANLGADLAARVARESIRLYCGAVLGAC